METDIPDSGDPAGCATHYEDTIIESDSARNDQGRKACAGSKVPGQSLPRTSPPPGTAEQTKEQFAVLRSRTERTTNKDIPSTAKRKYGGESNGESDVTGGLRKRGRRQMYPSLECKDAAGRP